MSTAGGVNARYIASWNGSSWSALAVGPGEGGAPDGHVSSLAVFDDDGAGPHPESLFAGGHYEFDGGMGQSSLAQWNGSSWSPLGSNGRKVSEMACFK